MRKPKHGSDYALKMRSRFREKTKNDNREKLRQEEATKEVMDDHLIEQHKKFRPGHTPESMAKERIFAKKYKREKGMDVLYNGTFSSFDFSVVTITGREHKPRLSHFAELKSQRKMPGDRQALKLDRYKLALEFRERFGIKVLVFFRYDDQPEGDYYVWEVLDENGKQRVLDFGYCSNYNPVTEQGNGNPVVWIPMSQLKKVEL